MDDDSDGTDDQEAKKEIDITNDPRIHCKLGHFYLLLENYAKGLSFF